MSKYNYNFDIFYQSSAISLYLLGAYMTDGCIETQKNNKGISFPRVATLSSQDIDWLELIRNLVCKDIPIVKTGDCFRLKFCSTEFCNYLISKGCIPNKSISLIFPNVSNEYLSDFIRGCIDGDGAIFSVKAGNYIDWEVSFYGASNNFMLGFSECLTRLKFKHKFVSILPINFKLRYINSKPVMAKHTQYRIRIRGKATIKFIEWLYYAGHEISMPRKNQKAMELLKHYQNKLTI